MDGWIKLHRGITEHWIWRDPIKLKWWLDILIVANHSSNKVNIGMDLFDCERGQTVMSLKNWATRWGVSRDTVRNFLVLLEKDGMISHENLGKSTRITICNYNTYQLNLHNEQTTVEQQAADKRPTSDTNKNDKKEKNVNNDNKNDLDSSENEFSGASDFQNEDDKNGKGKEKSSAKKEKVDCDAVVDLFHTCCPSFPRIIKISDSRKQKIKSRLGEMKNDWALLESVFKAMENSRFLRGENKNGWKATFDWVFDNEKNWLKIIEGNYNDKTPASGSTSNVNDIWENQ